MASCDDEFALLGDDANAQSHHHQHQAAFSTVPGHRFVAKAIVQIRHHPHQLSATVVSKPNKQRIGGTDDRNNEGIEDYGQDFSAVQTQASKSRDSFEIVNERHHLDCFTDEDPGDNPFGTQTTDEDNNEDPVEETRPEKKCRGAATSSSHHHQHFNQKQPLQAPPCSSYQTDAKRKDCDELSDGGSPYCHTSKPRSSAGADALASAVVSVSQSSSGEYRKDREEWSDSAIGCLLDAYMDKYVQLNRGNLRGRDWEDVAAIVTERYNKHKSGKSVEQCKNKIDNLKKRYKAECQRLSSGSLSVSHWPWFKKMEQIVSSSCKTTTDDDKSAVDPVSSAVVKQTKRYSVSTQGPAGILNILKIKSISTPKWKRVILKISGSIFAGYGPQNVDPKITMLIAREIELASHAGVEVAVAVGGGNFFCCDSWVSVTGIDRATAYHIGMMASVMNAMLLQASLEKIGVQTRVQTGFTMQELAEPYIRRRAIRHLEKRRVVIFGGIAAGTESPFFTTDTAAALRATEINAEVILKGTNGDGDYGYRPQNNAAVSFEHISYRELVSRGFTAMDMTAITFCEENNIPVVLFNILEPGNISRALCGDHIGILVDKSGRAC